MSIRNVTLIILVSAGLFGAGWSLQSYLGGTKPTQVMNQAAHELPPQVSDSELETLRRAAENSKEAGPYRELSKALMTKIAGNPNPNPELIFELIDTLSQVSAFDPKDSAALLMLADISFNQKAFTKAAELYEKYLKLKPENSGIRGRYASTLTFIGRYDDAIAELESMLKKDPKSFHAHAYLSITYAQQNNKEKAIEEGKLALKYAPNDEAKQRFKTFIGNLENPKEAEEDSANSGIIVNFVKVNPIAGPKFSYAKTEGSSLKLYFRDFPMQAMPPMAKEKFFGDILARAKESDTKGLKEIIFLDAGSEKEMDRLSLE